MESFIDRRRNPRVIVSAGATSDCVMAVTVRVLDLGVRGLLMASPQPLKVGERVRMTMRLGDRPVEATVVIRRVNAAAGTKGGYEIGAVFVSLDEATRRVVQQFLATGRSKVE